MSNFTDRMYATWLASHGATRSPQRGAGPGYGAQPHVSEAKPRPAQSATPVAGRPGKPPNPVSGAP